MASEKCSLGIGLGLLILSFILYMVGFSCPYWLEKFDEVDTNLERLGLWQVCFTPDGMALNTNEQQAWGITYRNCYWIFHEEIRIVHNIFGKPFFVWTQVLSTFSVAILILVIIMSVSRLCGGCQVDVKMHVAKTTAVLTIISVALMISGLIVFGLKTGHQDWIVNRNHIHLSWSYGLCAGGALILIFAALFFALAAFAASDAHRAKIKAKNYVLTSRRY